MLVEGKVIVECKAVEKRNPVFNAQFLTYLRLTGLKLGVLVNFGFLRIVDGFERVVNGL
jgi:GxxExxY protein